MKEKPMRLDQYLEDRTRVWTEKGHDLATINRMRAIAMNAWLAAIDYVEATDEPHS